MSVRKLWLALLGMTGSMACSEQPPKLLGAGDLANFDTPPADARIFYGDDPLQFGDLRLPPGEGPYPVVVFLHGGCWYSEYDITHSSKLTAALARNGVATWSLEYRRIGDAGGAWPGTFEDVSRGADYLRAIADEYELDLNRVIFAGHSAGGHLALWLAARSQQPADAPVRSENPLAIRGVLALAPAADFGLLHREATCDNAVDKLMGGSPQQFPDRYRWADPMQFKATKRPQIIFIGRHDDTWTPPATSYFQAARARGDDVRLLVAPDSGHFEMIDPDSSTWPLVLDAVRELLGQ
ncbi:MAG: alpha/beta hydrolase [Woeseia sp.]